MSKEAFHSLGPVGKDRFDILPHLQGVGDRTEDAKRQLILDFVDDAGAVRIGGEAVFVVP